MSSHVIDFSYLYMFIIFAQLIESRVLILRDYDEEPLILDHVDISSAEEVKHKLGAISSNYKPKRNSKRTILQYGRHIYHLDSFADLKDLRTKMTQFKPDSVSYDYVDIDDLFRASDSAKNGVGDYLKDLFINSNKQLQICSGDQCDEDLRKFSSHTNDDIINWKHKKMQLGRMKRFQIVDNRHKSTKPQSASSEEYHEKKKQKPSRKNKKKKKKHSFESTESKSNESSSAEKSLGFHKKKKRNNKPPKSAEESVELKRKPKKKHNYDDSGSANIQKWKNHDEDSKSNEDFYKKKKKKHNYAAYDQTKRKTYTAQKGIDYDFFMQGNKIFHTRTGKFKKRHYDFSKRRRLDNFLPKRYHWDPSEIGNLGYYWFNGPKGQYAAPKRLSK